MEMRLQRLFNFVFLVTIFNTLYVIRNIYMELYFYNPRIKLNGQGSNNYKNTRKNDLRKVIWYRYDRLGS